MPTPSERRALLFVAAVAALGLGVRGLRSLRPTAQPAGRAELVAQIAAVDSALTTGGRPRARRATAAASPRSAAQPTPAHSAAGMAERPATHAPVDVDRASEEELDALPGIGPALARRIVEDRSRLGAFGSLEALQDVRGIGPALTAKLAPFVSFSGPPRPRANPKRTDGSSHP